MITVDKKSRIESSKDAKTDKDEEVSATITLAISRKTFAKKFIKIAMFTILDELGRVENSSGNNDDSSSNETLLEGG